MPSLRSRWEKLSENVKEQLKQQGFKDERIQLEVYLNCRFDGTVSLLEAFVPVAGGNGLLM